MRQPITTYHYATWFAAQCAAVVLTPPAEEARAAKTLWREQADHRGDLEGEMADYLLERPGCTDAELAQRFGRAAVARHGEAAAARAMDMVEI